ncbi:MAG: hypothetical protein OXJ90_02370 [Spirochaetaceae bacterium]|nr:hypothetical protein [Spirochaetaceae bacterium]
MNVRTAAIVAPCGSPVTTTIHVDVCSPNFLIQEGIETFSEFHRDILTEPIVWQDGHIIPPTAPGLGYELNEEAIAPHLAAQAWQ